MKKRKTPERTGLQFKHDDLSLIGGWGESFPEPSYLYKSNIGPGVYRFLHVIQREHIAVVKYEGNWTWSPCRCKLRLSCDFIIEIMYGGLSHTIHECAYNLTSIPSAFSTALS